MVELSYSSAPDVVLLVICPNSSVDIALLEKSINSLLSSNQCCKFESPTFLDYLAYDLKAYQLCLHPVALRYFCHRVNRIGIDTPTLNGDADECYKILADEISALLRELSAQFRVDIALLTHSQYMMPKRLLCIDMDSCILKNESLDEIGILANVGDAIKKLTDQAMSQGLNFSTSLRNRLELLKHFNLAKHWPSLWGKMELNDGAARLTFVLNYRKVHMALVSGGFTIIAWPVASYLGIDDAFANVLDIDDSGEITGKVENPIVDGIAKDQILKKLANQAQMSVLETVAIGDGANDRYMTRTAGIGVGFRPKPLLRSHVNVALDFCSLDALIYLMFDKFIPLQMPLSMYNHPSLLVNIEAMQKVGVSMPTKEALAKFRFKPVSDVL